MFKDILLVGIFIVVTINGISQVLSHGDSLPDLELRNVLGYTKETLRPSDFHGKAIILDFWSTSCSSCLKAFPKIDSLQKQLSDQLQFILVNRESLDSTKKFFVKHSNIKAPCVPLITGDSVLINRFGIRGFPHTIWLDTNRVVKHSTAAYNITTAHVDEFLKGGHLNVREGIRKYRPGSPLTNGIDGLHDNLQYYSYVSKCIDGLLLTGSEYNVLDSKRNVGHLSKGCASIVELYKLAYSDGDRYRFDLKNSIELDVEHPERYVRPADQGLKDAWATQHAFSYELVVPANKITESYNIMKQDLDRMFGLSACVEKRSVEGLALTKVGNTARLMSTGGNFHNDLSNLGVIRKLKNGRIEHLAAMLKHWTRYSFGLPFINAVNIASPIDMILYSKPFLESDVKEVNKQLKKYGMALEKEMITIDVLVLSENIKK